MDLVDLLSSAFSLATVFLLGCLGETITEKVGHLNLGIPGIMCVGAAGGCWGVSLVMNLGEEPPYILLMVVCILCAFVFAALTGGIYAFLTVSLRCNQNITGLAVTTFGTGFSQFFIDTFVDKSKFFFASPIVRTSLPFADALGGFGSIFLSHGFIMYLSIALAILASLFLKKTKKGLYLRSIGENPATADAAGINVAEYKYIAILIGSGIAGLGGFYYIMDFIGGSWENASTVEALGWLSIALVIFTIWRPTLSIFGSIIFAIFYIIAFKITGVSFTFMAILKLLPYVITILVLIITSMTGSKIVQPPASLGLNYFREER